MTTDKALRQIFKEVSKELNIPIKVIDRAYREMYSFIKTTIVELPLKGMISEEELAKYRTSFNIPGLGKFYTSWDKLEGLKRRNEYLNKLKNEDKEIDSTETPTSGY